MEKFFRAQEGLIELIDQEFQIMIEDAELWLQEILSYYHNLGGKRLRPALLFAIGKSFSEDIDHLIPYGTAIELMHTFSLFHDDIIDEAQTRRGAMSVHRKFGVDSAIISGDILHSLIHGYLANQAVKNRLDSAKTLQFLSDLTLKVELPIATAVIKEANFAKGSEIPDFEEALAIDAEKTGPIFGLCAAAGSYLVDYNSQLDELWEFGYKLGIAYQLLDDIIAEVESFIQNFREQFIEILDQATTYLDESKAILETIKFHGQQDYLNAFMHSISHKLTTIRQNL